MEVVSVMLLGMVGVLNKFRYYYYYYCWDYSYNCNYGYSYNYNDIYIYNYNYTLGSEVLMLLWYAKLRMNQLGSLLWSLESRIILVFTSGQEHGSGVSG